MMMGMEIAARPANKMGLRKLMNGRPGSLRPATEPEISAQQLGQGLRSIGQHVMALVPLTPITQPLSEPVHFREVRLPDLGGAGEDFGRLFEAFKLDQTREREF